MKTINATKAILIPLCMLSIIPGSSSLRPPCVDDSNYTFGGFPFQGRMVTRSCSWLTENENRSRLRKQRWCDRKWIGITIGDKCQKSCNSCDQTELSFCEDRRMGNNGIWYDVNGNGCEFYEENFNNCDTFGRGGKSMWDIGLTAKTVCCVCGGGIEILG